MSTHKNALDSSGPRLAQLEQRIEQLETCYKITSLINSELNLANLLDTIMNVAKKVMNADACSLLLIDDETDELVFQIALSKVGEEIKSMTRLKMGEGIAGTVAETGESLLIEDAYQHPKFNPGYDKKTGFQTGSILCSPLKAKGKTIGVCQVIHGKSQERVFQSSDLQLFLLLCDSAALAIHNARMHMVLMENQRMEKDMEFAQSVQESFLPTSTPQHANFTFAALTHAAQVVGGDYYDFIPFENEMLGIVLGDVSGKGVPAALQMARLMSDFRYISQVDSEPAKVLTQVNNTLCERSYRGMFTTAVFCLLDMKNKKLCIANGGHLSLILKRNNSIQEIGSASGTPLGILPNMQYSQEEHTLKSGDQILIVTDGVTEPKNKQQEEFGIDRLKDMFVKHNGSPEEFLPNLENSIKGFIGDAPQFDDLTSLAFRAL
ncbi:MAG: SpoIIE family protein phosphatase [Nitrospinaceae bacterium]|nr:SpoIIE family protein phosphatase [Nitrospinaceae bacterium]